MQIIKKILMREVFLTISLKSFGIRISSLLESSNIRPQHVEKHFTPNIPAWCVKQPEILFDLHSVKNLNQINIY